MAKEKLASLDKEQVHIRDKAWADGSVAKQSSELPKVLEVYYNVGKYGDGTASFGR